MTKASKEEEALTYLNVPFDDFVFDSYSAKSTDKISKEEVYGYGQICESCREKYFPIVSDFCNCDEIICGVLNCENEAIYTLDFDVLEEIKVYSKSTEYLKSYNIPFQHIEIRNENYAGELLWAD